MLGNKSTNFSRLFRTRINGRLGKRFCQTPAVQNTKKSYEPLTYSSVKRSLLADTVTTKVFSWAALAAGVVSIVYYWVDSKNTPETKLATAIGMIQNDDPEMKQAGFNQLQESAFIKKRTFSGPVGLVSDLHGMASANVVSTLIDHLSNPQFSHEGLSWLLRLTDPDLPLSKKVKSLILEHDPQLRHITSLLTSEDYFSPQAEWLNASHLLLNFNKEELVNLNFDSVGSQIERMVASRDPVATITAARIFDKLGGDLSVEPGTREVLLNLEKSQASFPSRYSGLGATTVKPLTSSGPTASIGSIVIFSALASFWGKVFWAASASLSPSYRKVVQGADPEVAHAFRQKFLKSRRVGLSVFALCMLDYSFAYYLKQRPFIPDTELFENTHFIENNRMSYTTILPIAQTIVMTLVSLWAVKTQRFVLVPLSFVVVYNHYDLLKRNVFFDELLIQPAERAAESFQHTKQEFIKENLFSLEKK